MLSVDHEVATSGLVVGHFVVIFSAWLRKSWASLGIDAECHDIEAECHGLLLMHITGYTHQSRSKAVNGEIMHSSVPARIR